jgi:uncharacterized protein (TIGR03435 family)
MRTAISATGCLVFACGAVFGQTFEVASVKPAAPQASGIMRPSGGPGTSDPERFTYTNVTLKALLLRAYDVKNYQITGPAWLDSERFDILAKVPAGATKEQLNIMLQHLLADRFNLTFHHEAKEMAVYELTVGKSGSKLKEADLNAVAPTGEPGAPLRIGAPDKDGFPQIPAGLAVMLGRITDGISRWTDRLMILSDLTSLLESELDRPVVDKTGLTGKYDFSLAFSRDGLRPRGPAAAPDATPADPSGGPSLLNAVQEQLGLKLESKKDPIDILVLDHIDKVPTGN